MKLPELPKRKPKAESAGRSSFMSVQPPAFLQDLFKDMRDRRLIIPAVALLIAIVAVPVVLSSPSDSAVNVPSPVSDPDAVAVEPAVLAVQEVGVRDFRKRLDALKSKNPFGDRFEPKPVKDEGLEDAVDVGGTSGAGGGTGGLTDTGTVPDPTPPAQTEPPEPFVLVPRVDVTVGIMGRDQKDVFENVHVGDVLPSRQAPVALYMNNSEDSQQAGFLVSRDVSKVNGDGECRPGRNDCEFLTLEDGETAYLRYADDKRYSLRVTNIYFVHVPESEFNEQD